MVEILDDNELGLLDTGSSAQATVRASLQPVEAVTRELVAYGLRKGSQLFAVYRLRVKVFRQFVLSLPTTQLLPRGRHKSRCS